MRSLRSAKTKPKVRWPVLGRGRGLAAQARRSDHLDITRCSSSRHEMRVPRRPAPTLIAARPSPAACLRPTRLRHNTKPDAKIMSWWDYGYQITAMGNRTVIVDNNTWNNTHIATVGERQRPGSEVLQARLCCRATATRDGHACL